VTTPAGWFPDPEGAGGQRFWNGDQRTEHCAPDAPPAVDADGVRTTDHRRPRIPRTERDRPGTNVSAHPKTFFASFNTLSDGTTVFEPDDGAWLYLGHTVTDVGPGASIETEVVFDVPRDTDLESIWFRGGPLSEGVAVAL
jgi:hypothetical protein